ncbi:hypothetical protein MBLNU459_g7100t3 [Dothideomycetes sp. NU459]
MSNPDSVKRRFIRQNRELAKNNSAQCLRIRSLECDMSRLLAENLNLREEILRLQGQLCATETRINSSSLLSVKDQLEAKLREFGSLISELDTLQESRSDQISDISSRRHPNPASWRPEIPLAALNGQAPRMSGIVEEGSSPEGTLRNESPDLGPPPIAHFECEDPIKFDPLPRDNSQNEQSIDDAEMLPTNLSVNLETRRRRKDGHSRLDGRRSSIFPADAEEQTQPLRTSAKRKLSVRDAEDTSGKPAKDDFVFSRRASNVAELKKTESGGESGQSIKDKDESVAASPTQLSARTERKVLGNKSVNMSPRKVSVNKNAKDELGKPDKPDKPAKDIAKATGRERRSRVSSVKPLAVNVDVVVDTVEINIPEEAPIEGLAPETPAPDFFSPTPSEPSAARGEARDTPPPSGLKSVMSGSASLNGASRPSRRARAAVNYAEPNLVSKMRRPTKELADAVLLNSRNSMSNLPVSADKAAMRTVVIKREEGNVSDWKSFQSTTGPQLPEPGSPLGAKSGTIITDPEPVRDEASTKPSASGIAISALMSGASRAKPAHAVNDECDVTETVQKMQEMDLYDFKDSSPLEEGASKGAAKAKGSRRHSSVVEPAARDSVAKRRASRLVERPHSTVGDVTVVSDRPEKNKDLAEGGGQAEGRGERMASRRRSMMV